MNWVRLALLVLVTISLSNGRPSARSTSATPLGPSDFDVGTATLVAALPAGIGTPGGPLVLAPSGDAIVFASALETDALAILDLASGRVRQIGQGMTRPVWSPSADALLVGYTFPGERLSSVAVVDRASGSLRPITSQPADGPPRRDVPAGWSGQALYYQRTFPDQPDRVEIHRVAGGGDDAVAWSGDGVRVLTDRPIPVADGFLVAVAVDGVPAWRLIDPDGGETPLGASPLSQRITQASVSPDGARIAYGGGVQLVVAPTADPGAAVAVLPFGQGPGAGFAWSPAGDRLVVSDGTTLTIYAVDGRSVLATSANSGGIPIGGPLWLPDGIYFLQRGGEVAIRRLPLAPGDDIAWPPLPTPTPAPDFPATIAALSTRQASSNEAGTAAALAANATIAAGAASEAAFAATTVALATSAADVAVLATANARGGANALATAETQAITAQTALAAAQATGAALATRQASTPPSPIVVNMPTAPPAASPVASMSQRYVEVAVQLNPDGLLAGEGGAEDAARDALHAALDRFAGCRVGVVSTFGGGAIAEGVALARAVNALLLDEFPDLFGGAAAPDDFFDQTLPRGAVTLRLYFFSGCAAAETPAAETPTGPTATPGIELRPA